MDGQKQQARALLDQYGGNGGREEFINLYHALDCEGTEVVGCMDGGIVLRLGQGFYACVCFNQEAIAELAGMMQDADGVSVRAEKNGIDVLAKSLGLPVDMECIVVSWLHPEPPPFPARAAGLTIDLADEGDLPFILEHYHYDDKKYIMDRLAKGAVFRGKVDGNMVGFIGIHDEGSMGMLNIIPPFRRKGYAQALESWLCSYIMDRGQVPYGEIVTTNAASLALHAKTGFHTEKMPSAWLMHPV